MSVQATWGALLSSFFSCLAALLQEFIRVGYYVNTEYVDEVLRDDPPDNPEVDK